jgi:5-methylcytosine-specific restriction endonuclease McrA
MKCQKCGNEFSPTKGLKSYCSLQCRNSRKFTKESRELKAEKSREFFQGLSIEGKAQILKKMDMMRLKRSTRMEYLQSKDFQQLSWDSKRTKVIIEQGLKCANCGIDEWLGQPITLEIDHIDGDNKNDARENLEALCPNCHSQTPTWRGRHENNKGKKQLRVELAFQESQSVVPA